MFGSKFYLLAPRCFAVVGALCFAAPLLAQPTMNDPNLEVVPFATGLSQPIGIVFPSPSEAWILEKATGKVRRFVGGVESGTILDLAVNSASERGLLSLVVHPNFPATPFAYAFWSQSTTGADTIDASAIATLGNRIDRFVWNGTSLTFDRNLISMRGFQADANQPVRGNHNGGVLRFGPDGKLYAIAGDRGRRGYCQNILNGPNPDDQFGGPAPDAAHTTGVIYRINEDGTIPSDNPFIGRTPYPSMDMVYGYGVRNGFGLAFDPQSGKLWSCENGDDSFDEINLVEAGFNGGWTQVMGPLSRIDQYRDIEVTLAGGLQQLRWPPTNIQTNFLSAYKKMWHIKGSKYTDPKFSWKYAVAPSCLNFVDGDRLGPKYEGDMIVTASRTTLLNGYLMRLDMNANRTGFEFTDSRLLDGVADNASKFDPVESESLIIGQGFGISPTIENGPGGMYLTSLDQSAVYLIRRRQ